MGSQPFQAKLAFCADPVPERSRITAGFALDQSPATISEERHLQVTERHGRDKVFCPQHSGAHPARLLRQSFKHSQLPDVSLALQGHTKLDARRGCSGLYSVAWRSSAMRGKIALSVPLCLPVGIR